MLLIIVEPIIIPVVVITGVVEVDCVVVSVGVGVGVGGVVVVGDDGEDGVVLSVVVTVVPAVVGGVLVVEVDVVVPSVVVTVEKAMYLYIQPCLKSKLAPTPTRAVTILYLTIRNMHMYCNKQLML